MNEHYESDSKCMTRNFIIAAIVAVIITAILGIWMSNIASIILLLVLLVIGWFLAAYLCKARTVNRSDAVAAPVAKAEPVAKTAPAPAPAPAPAAKAAPAPKAKPAPAPAAKASKPKAKAKPAAAAEPAASADGDKPKMLTKARGGNADDLKKIKGVGPKLEKELNGAGVFHYDQIAGWSKSEVEWADQHLVSFKGRVSRDNWVDQAKALAKG